MYLTKQVGEQGSEIVHGMYLTNQVGEQGLKIVASFIGEIGPAITRKRECT
jgi:hypothetical protein